MRCFPTHLGVLVCGGTQCAQAAQAENAECQRDLRKLLQQREAFERRFKADITAVGTSVCARASRVGHVL